MASDLDRYGARLGKRFEAARAIICSQRGTAAAAEALGSYIFREFFRADDDLEALYNEGWRLVEASRDWLPGIQDARLQRFLRRGSRSVQACHIVDAAHDLMNHSLSPANLLERVAARAVDETEARVHMQRNYVRDKEAHDAVAAIKALAIADLVRRFRPRLERSAGLPVVRSSTPTFALSALLDLVVARSSDGR